MWIFNVGNIFNIYLLIWYGKYDLQGTRQGTYPKVTSICVIISSITHAQTTSTEERKKWLSLICINHTKPSTHSWMALFYKVWTDFDWRIKLVKLCMFKMHEQKKSVFFSNFQSKNSLIFMGFFVDPALIAEIYQSESSFG